jgi:hypothetical protein
MRARSKLLNIIALGYDEYKKGKTRWNTLNLLLDRLNRLMNTGYGFFGRLQDGPEGKPVCLAHGLARVAFDCHCARCCGRLLAAAARYHCDNRSESHCSPSSPQILKVLCYTNIAWTQELKNLVNTVRELEFQLEV